MVTDRVPAPVPELGDVIAELRQRLADLLADNERLRAELAEARRMADVKAGQG